MKPKGFTLIELLVALSIIGLLMTIIVGAVSKGRDNAKVAKAKQEAVQIAKAIVIAQGEQGKPLPQITGSGCTDCPCRSGNIKNDTGACYTGWVNALGIIQNATNGIVKGLTLITRDPWGSPYLLDENEKELGASDCRNDLIQSAGPDGIYGGADAISVTIPMLSNPCP